jgi:hypothetical protein
MSEWITDENKHCSVAEFVESVTRGYERLRYSIGRIEPHRVYFRGIIFECGDPRLKFMIDNNIQNYKELTERYAE